MCKKVCKIGIPLLLYIAAMTTFAFFDLDISNAMYNKENLFGKIFEVIGEVPFTFIALIGFTTLFITRNRNVKWKNILIAIIAVVGMLAYGFLLPFFVLNYLKVSKAWIYGIVLMLPNCAASYFSMKWLCQKHGDELKTVAIIAILTILGQQVFVNLIKVIWGRPRMRDMSDPITEFIPWYLPNWFGGGNSFPSGHSANAACVVVITLLPDVFSRRKKVGYAITVGISYLWLISVMVSRVIAGAHFASDVTTGATITLAIFYSVKCFIHDKIRIDNKTQEINSQTECN